MPNLVAKNANAKGVRIIGSPSILRWSGRASHLETTKNHQTQCQCRISWDRKQSLLVDPIRAPTRDNASRLGGLAPRELRTLNPDAPGAACRTLDDCQGRRPHGRSWNCHDKVASYVGKEAGPSRIGSDMRDPICSICFPCYQPIKSRSIKQVHMFPCSHTFYVFM